MPNRVKFLGPENCLCVFPNVKTVQGYRTLVRGGGRKYLPEAGAVPGFTGRPVQSLAQRNIAPTAPAPPGFLT